jgi:hypothetical protein
MLQFINPIGKNLKIIKLHQGFLVMLLDCTLTSFGKG